MKYVNVSSHRSRGPFRYRCDHKSIHHIGTSARLCCWISIHEVYFRRSRSTSCKYSTRKPNLFLFSFDLTAQKNFQVEVPETIKLGDADKRLKICLWVGVRFKQKISQTYIFDKRIYFPHHRARIW